MTKFDLQTTEFDSYFLRYINKVEDKTHLREGFENGLSTVVDFFTSIPEDKLEFRYAPKKWTVKEVLQHLIDTERIFMYRCFRIARRDDTPLTGFDQNIYIEPSGANKKSIEELIFEFEMNRRNSASMLNSLSDENLAYIGNSNGSAMSARAAAFTILGHDIWHMEIIKERYL